MDDDLAAHMAPFFCPFDKSEKSGVQVSEKRRLLRSLSSSLTKDAVEIGCPKRLISDCLDDVDTAFLKKSLSSTEFAMMFQQDDVPADREDIKTWDDAEKSIESWEDATEAVKKEMAKQKRVTESIVKDGQNMQEHGLLSVESRSFEVWQLCSQMQPRLKHCFVQLEETLMNENMKNLQSSARDHGQIIQQLKDKGFLTEEDHTKLQKKLGEVETSMLEDVNKLGYGTTREFVMQCTGWGCITATPLGLWAASGVYYGSTSFGAFLSAPSAVTFAGLSTHAAIGLAAGGLGVGVGVVCLCIWARCYLTDPPEEEKAKQRASVDILNSMNESLGGLAKAHRVSAEHTQKLTRLTNGMTQLFVSAST